jgi:hypothetical protein
MGAKLMEAHMAQTGPGKHWTNTLEMRAVKPL